VTRQREYYFSTSHPGSPFPALNSRCPLLQTSPGALLFSLFLEVASESTAASWKSTNVDRLRRITATGIKPDLASSTMRCIFSLDGYTRTLDSFGLFLSGGSLGTMLSQIIDVVYKVVES
jgi:hypothetical protein